MMNTHNLDLHMHSTVSDGTDTPEELILRVREAKLELFALTDHDAVKGCERIRLALKEGDPSFIGGVEFSCKDEDGKYHILGYGYDPASPSIVQLVEKSHGFRMKKVKARLSFLQEKFGFAFPQEEIDGLLALDNPGKPHIGNLMVKYHFAQTKDEAINEYINQAKFHTEYIRPEEAIEGILSGGGIPVLAHPAYGSGNELILDEQMDRRVQKLMGFGLQGMECFYSGFAPKLSGEMLSLAEKYHLYVTAGSDYHGKNKFVVLGKTYFEGDVLMPEGMRRFLTDVHIG
ncbi:MAG: PHP domain-containing protein [Blautia sp.]|nr:PHP domain-containing protein [Blautia sp.]